MTHLHNRFHSIPLTEHTLLRHTQRLFDHLDLVLNDKAAYLDEDPIVFTGTMQVTPGPLLVGTSDPGGSAPLRVGAVAGASIKAAGSIDGRGVIVRGVSTGPSASVFFADDLGAEADWEVRMSLTGDDSLEFLGRPPAGVFTRRFAIKADGQVSVPTGPLVVGPDPGGSQILRVGNDIIVKGSDATANGIRCDVHNTATATHSFAVVQVAGNNGGVVGQIMADGLGSSVLGAAGMYVGTFSNHPAALVTNNVVRWWVRAAGHLEPHVDATYDIGIGGGTPFRPRDIVLSRDITVGRQAIFAADVGTRYNNHTNGAGAAVGTLNNAPAAGDPVFWLPVSIAGTTRHIPCW